MVVDFREPGGGLALLAPLDSYLLPAQYRSLLESLCPCMRTYVRRRWIDLAGWEIL